jgi:hypothetical protein
MINLYEVLRLGSRTIHRVYIVKKMFHLTRKSNLLFQQKEYEEFTLDGLDKFCAHGEKILDYLESHTLQTYSTLFDEEQLQTLNSSMAVLRTWTIPCNVRHLKRRDIEDRIISEFNTINQLIRTITIYY